MLINALLLNSMNNRLPSLSGKPILHISVSPPFLGPRTLKTTGGTKILESINWKKLNFVNAEAKKFYKDLENNQLRSSTTTTSPLGKRSFVDQPVTSSNSPGTRSDAVGSSSYQVSFKRMKQEDNELDFSLTASTSQQTQIKSEIIVLWYWENNANWKVYDKASAQIEAAYQDYINTKDANKQSFNFSDTHIIDFKLMKQINKKEQWRTRKVKRDEQFITQVTNV